MKVALSQAYAARCACALSLISCAISAWPAQICCKLGQPFATIGFVHLTPESGRNHDLSCKPWPHARSQWRQARHP